ncbi:MAG: CBS domain-containing protein [Hyphomicrobiaceae bacterium]|nr:CBS domain-containing protein [Hyphomicrobiaceae bacterium]
MLVSDILKSKGASVKMIRSDDSAMVCAQRLSAERVGALVVSDNGRSLDGIISERDIAYGLAKHGPGLHAVPVRDLMTKAVITSGPRESIVQVMRVMTQRRIRHLPIVDNDRLAGIVTSGDVLKHRLEEVQLEANVLRDAVIAAR